MFNFLACYAFFLCLYIARAANWAQTTGKVKQNVVIPKMPTPTSRHWQARYGQLVIVASNDLETGQLYLMGGDTNDGDTDSTEVNKKQYTWSNGYKNDVWRTTGTEWQVISDIRLESKFKEKIPRVISQMSWTQVSVGTIPTPGITYDEWLSCQPVFRYKLPNPSICNTEEWQYKVQWSPRRHHAGVQFKGYLWVMGGRARELEPLAEIRSVGGIMTPRVADIYRERIGINYLQKFSTQRETSGYKSDVWRSVDGDSWQLVSPGCRAPQINLIAFGNAAEGRAGIEEFRCETNEDCYSPAEECRNVVGAYRTCVCKMWSPREQHSVSAYGDYMYVIGGFTSILFDGLSNCGPYACGDTDAGSYRHYAQDVWRSSDGETWTPMTLESFPGRGGHQTIVLPDIHGVITKAQLVVFGGEGGIPKTNEVHYFNDMWAAYVDNPGVWRQLQTNQIPWSPRTGHTVTLEPASAANMNKRIVFLAGGKTEDDAYSDEVWSWRPDVVNDTWKLDYTPEALFRSASGLSAQEGELYATNSPSMYYVTPDSNLSTLIKFWVPTQDNKDMKRGGTRPEYRVYLEETRIRQLNEVGLMTIRDLAEAGKYDILKLRGFDVPQVPLDQRYDFYDICDVRALAIAVVEKCRVKDLKYYDGEQNMPWNNEIKFGGSPPVSMAAEWHNRNYSEMIETVDPVQMVEEWDGCAKLPLETLPNVNGLGKVSQVDSIRNPRPELQELHCKINPGPRAYHAAAFFKERFYVFGGRHSENGYNADTWYRDDRMPTVNIRQKPTTNTPDSVFKFAADEAGCAFEYRIWNPYAFKELRRWTSVVKKADVDWLDWRKGGPGNGRYMLYVRAVDPAGNRDETFQFGRNVYVWNYVSPTPWDIILGSLAAFLFLCFLGYLEYRRRVKKAAMERYAMKRMRRKFKAMQRDMDGRAVDWRTLYQESKEQREKEGVDGKDKAREQKKKRDKAKEAREKEKEKREKEKEKIRKKLKQRDKKRPAIGSTGVRGDDWALESEKGEKSMANSEAGDTKKSKRKGKEGDKDLFDDKDPSAVGSTVSKRNKRFKEYEQSSDASESRIKKL